jgi:phage terminase small subunit
MSRVRVPTPRQQRFIAEFLVDLNATKAAIRAGYSPATARQQASRLLARPHIAAAVARAQATVAAELEITAEGVVGELVRISRANAIDFIKVGPEGDFRIDLSHLSRDQAAGLVEITVDEFKTGQGTRARNVRRVKIKLADKLGALVQIGRLLGFLSADRTARGTDPVFGDRSAIIPELASLIVSQPETP